LRAEDWTAVTMKIAFFCDVEPHSLIERCFDFEGIYASIFKVETPFHPKDKGSRFLRNLDIFLTGNMPSQSRKGYSSMK
jgi:hypothetical protein